MHKNFIRQQEVHGWLRHLLDKFATDTICSTKCPKKKNGVFDI
jgi:hypothetical protein